LANLLEYAFNLDPRVISHPGLPRAFVGNVDGQDYLHVQYTRRNPPAGVTYLLQSSTDLFSWNTSPGSFTPVSVSDNNDGTSLVTLRLQTPITDVTQSFVRIAVQR
jgi:hypothetical protein